MVSIIVPTYNYGHFIADTLGSVQKQTFADWECIIVDNGSTDNTAAVVEPFLADTRFRMVRQENLGVSAGRNRGLKEARGQYIQFLDADDLLEPGKLEASVLFLDTNPPVSLLYSSMRYFRNEEPDKLYYGYQCDRSSDRPWMTKVSGKGKDLLEVLLEGNIMVISSPVYRRAHFDLLFDETLRHNEDWDFWLRMALAGLEFRYFEKPGTNALVRIHRSSASQNVYRMQISGLAVLLKNYQAVHSAGLSQQLRLRILDHKKNIVRSFLAMKGKELQVAISFLKDKGLYGEIFNFRISSLIVYRLYLLFRTIKPHAV